MFKAKEEVIRYKDVDIDIKDVTLLSEEEYNEYKHIIPPVNVWWWLRQSKSFKNNAAFVNADGLVYYFFFYGKNPSLYVRPAIVCRRSVLKPCTKIFLFNRRWTVLNDSLILCDEHIGSSCFRTDVKAPDANVYRCSDVKKYLENWAAQNGFTTGGQANVC